MLQEQVGEMASRYKECFGEVFRFQIINSTLWVDHISERHNGWYPASSGPGIIYLFSCKLNTSQVFDISVSKSSRSLPSSHSSSQLYRITHCELSIGGGETKTSQRLVDTRICISPDKSFRTLAFAGYGFQNCLANRRCIADKMQHSCNWLDLFL